MARPTVRILSRYLLRQHLAPLGFALAAFTLLMLLRQVAQQFGNLVGKGLPWSVILEVVERQFFLRAARIDPATNRLRDVTIYDLGDPERRRIISADSGRMAYTPGGRDLYLTLLDGDIREVNRSDPTQFDRTLYVVNKIRVQNVGNSLERTENDSYRSDREMSICEMRGVVAAARHEAEQARRGARRLIDNDLRRLAGLGPVLRDTLGLAPDTEPQGAYCRALRRLAGWLVPTAAIAGPPHQGVPPGQGAPPKQGPPPPRGATAPRPPEPET